MNTNRYPFRRCIPHVLAFLLTLCLISLQADAEESSAKEAPVSVTSSVKYSSPQEDVEISGTKVVYRIREMEFPSPSADVPKRVVTVTREASVSPQEIDQILSFIRSAKFFDLSDQYGAMPDQRYYPYTIQVNDGDRQKTVTYRSNPSAGKPPAAFFAVEKHVVGFAKAATRARACEQSQQ